MGQKRQRTEAVLEVGSEAAHLDAGREFKTKPGESFKSRFIDHIRKTGTPVGFPGLCWTTPDFDDAPELIVKFGTPEALRKTVAMTPCPVCSPRSPKYYDGLLGWSPKDKRVRAIGNECGHGHFTDGTFRQSLDAFDAAEALKTAREYLKAVLPDLPRRLFEARLLVKDADLLMRMRDELVSNITKNAVSAMRKALDGTSRLTIERGSDTRDGRGARLVDRVPVTDVVSIDGASVSTKSRDAVERICLVLGQRLVLRDHSHPLWRDIVSWEEALDTMTSDDAIVLERAHRDFVQALARLENDYASIRRLLSTANLNQLNRWGVHPETPTPFWIKSGPAEVRAGKGPRIQATGRRIPGLPIAD